MPDKLVENIRKHCEGDRSLHIFSLENAMRELLNVTRQRSNHPEGGNERTIMYKLEKQYPWPLPEGEYDE